MAGDCEGGVCAWDTCSLCSKHLDEAYEDAYRLQDELRQRRATEEGVKLNDTPTRSFLHGITARLRRGASRGA